MPTSPLKSGRYALLSISDTGTGIKKELLNKIFEPYFTTKEHGKGTGLGLATVYGIVKGHDGDVQVYSEMGKGATFNVYFPIAENSEEPVFASPKDIYPTGNEKILIVDDEPSVVKLEARMLERLGYQVTSFSSSAEALDAFRAQPENFDIVITDMTMPGMTGDKLATEMICIRPDICIIICTGFSERLNRDSSQHMGAKAFLMKPVGLKELSNTVRKILDEI